MQLTTGHIAVRMCRPGPEPKKITARASSKNLKDHFEGFLSVNMTDVNADYADALMTPLRPTQDSMMTQRQFWVKFFSDFIRLYEMKLKKNNTYSQNQLLWFMKRMNELYPGFLNSSCMCELVAFAMGYSSYSRMEDRAFVEKDQMKYTRCRKCSLQDFLNYLQHMKPA